MKQEKFIKFLKLFIIILTIVLVIAIPASIIIQSPKSKIKTNKCTKKGNVCTIEEIISGVEVEYEVSKGTRYIFNVISNTEDSMTLMLNKNLGSKVDWHNELVNIKGPDAAMLKVIDATKTWDKVPLITDYSYSDFGKIDFEEKCIEKKQLEPDYDCSTDYNLSRGYNSLNIIDGKLTIFTNIVVNDPSFKVNNVAEYKDNDVHARLITYEEINLLNRNLSMPNWLTSNLKDNSGYWTLSSTTAKKTAYVQGALAIAKVDSKPSLETLYVMNDYNNGYDIGVRPVITIPKE